MHHNIEFRKLLPYDIDEIRRLCQKWFPVRYPDTWYIDITNSSNNLHVDLSSRYYTECAIDTTSLQIVGILVAEHKILYECNVEDLKNLLNFSDNPIESTKVTYIMVLGVAESFRNLGIATNLLNNLLAHLINFTCHETINYFASNFISNTKEENQLKLFAMSYRILQDVFFVLKSILAITKIKCLKYFSHKSSLPPYLIKNKSIKDVGKGLNSQSNLTSTLSEEKSNQHYCKCIYLHVLASNHNARKFYEKYKFKCHNFLPNYYNVPSGSGHAYSYVLYINGASTPTNVNNHPLNALNKMTNLVNWPTSLQNTSKHYTH